MFKSLSDLVIFSTTEDRDVSFVNNFGLDAKSSNKLFMYIRKNNGPISVTSHEDYCPFRSTLYFR